MSPEIGGEAEPEPDRRNGPLLRILHVTAPAPYGGLETVVTRLAEGHARRGHGVGVAAVLSPGDASSPFVEGLRDAGVEVHALTVGRRAYVTERRRIGALCETARPHVVHTHGYRSDVVDAPVARALGLPTVATVHGRTGRGPRSRLYGWLQRRALRHHDAIVAVSAELHAALAEDAAIGARLDLIPNAAPGVPAPLSRAAARSLLGLPARGFHVGWVGRISEEKGLDVFLEALPSLADLSPVVSIVGDGPEATRLGARSAASTPAVVWHGAVPAAARVLPAFDVLVLSSRREGTPMVLLEAAALGIPVVASDVGGVADAIGPNDALLVPPEQPQEIAEAIRDVHDRPGQAAARAERAAARVREASERWLDAYEDLYRRLQRPTPA